MLTALKTKRARAGLVVLVLLACAGAAVAYFTTTGTGSGSATAGTSSPLTISATMNPASGLLPGGSPADVTFSVNNPSGGNQNVGTVTLTSVSAYTDNTQATPIPGCSSSWFTMTPVTENQDVPSGNTTLTAHGSLQFNDAATSQDACKGAFLVAHFSSN